MQSYSLEPHVRKHGPTGFLTYQSFKPWLRDEFTFRCVYCLERERWYPSGHSAFGVDHVKPKSDRKYSHLECVYGNLLYACNRCNSAKGCSTLIDPTETAIGLHVAVDDQGQIAGLTPEGRFLIAVLNLDADWVTATRRRYIRIASLYQAHPEDAEVAELYFDAFGYPMDLPNLLDLRPQANTSPEGLQECFWIRRTNNALGSVYPA